MLGILGLGAIYVQMNEVMAIFEYRPNVVLEL
jgi:hypothetical protein